jgi:Zn-dependent protease with chaperone function
MVLETSFSQPQEKPEAMLQQGKAALKAGDYQGAITILNPLCQAIRDPQLLTRAQKVLVLAYIKNGNTAKAISLCRSLLQPPVPPENAWARKVLKEIKKRQKSAEVEPPELSTPSVERQWRNEPGSETWQLIKPPKTRRLVTAGGVGAITLFFLIHTTLTLCIELINTVLAKIPFLPFLPEAVTSHLIPTLLVFLIASPWLLDTLLRHRHHLRPLPFADFRTTYPETARSIHRACRQGKLPLPNLDLLPTSAPIIFTYGHFWGTTHLVMSEGLLAQLSETELATLMATQIGQRSLGDGIFLSAAVTLLQIPYTLYQVISLWGDDDFRPAFLRGIAAMGAGLAYGIYWLWRLPLLWLSKLRIYYSDRFAVEATGDPNALSRAILKVSIGISQHITDTQETPWILEGFDLLLPVGYQQAISIGSIPPNTPFETVLAWECLNPYRHWLNFLNSYPLMGDRLYVLSRYAKLWNLQPELDLTTITPSEKTNVGRYEKLKQSYLALPLFQSACLTSFVFLAIFKLSFGVINLITPGEVAWIHQALPFLNGCALITFSLCIIIWINGYFPDIKNPKQQAISSLPDLLTNPHTVPPHSQPVYLEGKILGRKGINNWLSQDIILQTEQGLIQLQFLSRFGFIGNLAYNSIHLNELRNETITVQGWFRRAGNVWIDIDQVILKNKKIIQSGYPLWLTGLAMGTAMLASYLILKA